ncbi:aldehyde dehydrogenase family protein [Brevibacterium sp. JSBI002]|uniref:aldehyde dehydrogenase family protein n=1 Tax=Brevibacterium sp. JSBI002 TaxID=2886045 RepID=UPI00223014F3|nr:aldehyde dehydrogenase family protein [Brevibacterium sp. JSBI002]UZD61666.1 aldehyde dehydrogenase family protein [Brevibacterium sp. JSBI002]
MTAQHVFAHDAESTDEVVGTGGTLKGLGELLTERERSAPLARAADLMDERRWDLADLLTPEMGRLRAEAEAEVELAARILRCYAEEGPLLLSDEVLASSSGGSAVMKYELIGQARIELSAVGSGLRTGHERCGAAVRLLSQRLRRQ